MKKFGAVIVTDKRLIDSFTDFYNIIIKLRSPGGCPWDREQTAETLRTNLIEEVYECVEAITEKDDSHTQEELGDVFLLAAMISRIKEEEGAFRLSDVFDTISEKLIRRHPHVFSDTEVNSSADVIKNWKEIKETIEKKGKSDSLLEGISKNIPPLERAYKIQKKASSAGFDWTEPEDVLDKIDEELEEFRHETLDPGNKSRMEEEFGDLLFSIINIGRFYNIDPGTALHMTNEKFIKRFKYVEKGMKDSSIPMNRKNLKIMDSFWEKAKSGEK